MNSPHAPHWDASDLEHGCVDWFDYERHAKPPRGRPDRPRGPRDSVARPYHWRASLPASWPPAAWNASWRIRLGELI